MLNETCNLNTFRKISFWILGTSWKIRFWNLWDLDTLWYILENEYLGIPLNIPTPTPAWWKYVQELCKSIELLRAIFAPTGPEMYLWSQDIAINMPYRTLLGLPGPKIHFRSLHVLKTPWKLLLRWENRSVTIRVHYKLQLIKNSWWKHKIPKNLDFCVDRQYPPTSPSVECGTYMVQASFQQSQEAKHFSQQTQKAQQAQQLSEPATWPSSQPAGSQGASQQKAKKPAWNLTKVSETATVCLFGCSRV